MKNYIVFVLDDYYPSGGFKDYAECYDTPEEAEAYLKGRLQGDYCAGGHVYSLKDEKIIIDLKSKMQGDYKNEVD